MAKSQIRKMTFQGQIVPYEFDSEGDITSVLVYDDEENEYIVEPRGIGRQLIDHLDEYIDVTGTVRKSAGEYRLTVLEFDVIGDPDGEYDDGWNTDTDDDYSPGDPYDGWDLN